MSGRWCLAAGLAWVLAAGVVEAQERNPGPQQRREAFRMIDAYMIANIQESLELTDEQFVEIIPLVKSLQTARREHFMNRAQTLRNLRMLLKSGMATEDQLTAALSTLKTLEIEGPAGVRERQDALDAVLDPVQQAKYRVFEAEVENRIRNLSRRQRQERMQQGRDTP